jgi:CheY-like chemotaxis protein
MFRILHIDDDDDKLTLVNLFAKRIGIKTICFNDVFSFMNSNKTMIDGIILDYHMPILNGIESAALLRQQGFLQRLAFYTSDENINQTLIPDEINCKAVFHSNYKNNIFSTLKTVVGYSTSIRKFPRQKVSYEINLVFPNKSIQKVNVFNKSEGGIGISNIKDKINVNDTLSEPNNTKYKVTWASNQSPFKAGLKKY